MSYAGGFPAKKNAEFLLVFPIYDNTGALVTGAAALDSEISKDGGAFNDCTNEAVEIGTSGVYQLTLTADEMNADVIAIITKTTTADAKTTATVIYTSNIQLGALATEAKQDVIDGIVDNIKSYLIDGGSIDLLIDAIKAKTDNLTTVAEIVDAIWDELKAGHTNAGSFGDYLDSKISLIAGAAGAGAITWVYTLTDADTGNPISEADVWITTDEAGNNVIASGKTDAYGKVTFYLDAGEIFVWRQRSGYDFVNPDVEVVS